VPGGEIEAYIADDALCRLVREVSRGCHIDFEDLPAVDLKTAQGKFLVARSQPVLGEKRECLGAVVSLVDVTALKALDQLKSQFVAKVSHELRSPLATIHEQLAMVLNDVLSGSFPDDLHLLTRAKEKTAGLIALIGDLLDLSRIEEGLICREPQPVELGELLRNVVDFLTTRAQAKGQHLTLALPATPLPPVSADPIGLESIFGNLITNAINYTPEGGTISVTADRAGINLRVRVKDNGFGIEARHLEKIFERFYRVKDAKTRYITGTGLGLPIVKGLVNALGGVISVEREPGAGSLFEVLLPCASHGTPQVS
jgi:signal transduction histidine kinase